MKLVLYIYFGFKSTFEFYSKSTLKFIHKSISSTHFLLKYLKNSSFLKKFFLISFPTGSIINYSSWKETLRSLRAINKKQTRRKHLEQRFFKKPVFLVGCEVSRFFFCCFVLLFIFCIIIFMFTAHFFHKRKVKKKCF